MTIDPSPLPSKSRLKALLEHFDRIDDPRQCWKVRHPLPEILLLVVCGTICDCDDYEGITAWGEAHLPFLREHLPYHHGVPGERWLTILMNRIPPALFAAAFTDWVRETWPETPDLVAIDGKTSRRSHDRKAGQPPLHLVSAFATTAKLVLGQEAVASKSNEVTAIPVLIERLAVDDGLKGALVSIDAIATNATIAGSVRDAGADYLLAVKANQPTLRAETEALFADTPAAELDEHRDIGKSSWSYREPLHDRLPRDRLARGRPPLSRRTAAARRRLHHPGRLTDATQGPLPLRDPVLHLIGPAHRRARRPCRAWPLGHRERAALGTRCHFQGRPVPAAQGPRSTQHGRRPTLRPQPHPQRTRQAVPQTPQKTSRMGHRIPQRYSQIRTPLTSIRDPASERCRRKYRSMPVWSLSKTKSHLAFARKQIPNADEPLTESLC